MKLCFKRESNEDIKVCFKIGEEYEEFSYSKMIKYLYDQNLEESEIIGEFTDVEKKSIHELESELKSAVENVAEEKEDDMVEVENNKEEQDIWEF